MERQLIISVGREFGSGGHVIAEELARRFELPLYDSNLLENVALEKNVAHEGLQKYDEKPKVKLFYRTVRGHSNSPHEHVANMQFDFLKREADAGKSFVIVGRCAETVLKGNAGLISIFVLGDKMAKRARIMEKYGITEDEARRMMEKEDLKRKSYHNSHCKGKWGDSRNYDLSINSSRLGIDKTIDMVEYYIRTRIENEA